MKLEEEKEKDRKPQQISYLNNEIDYLKNELKLANEEINKCVEDNDILKELYNKGYIDEDGNPTNREHP